MDLNIHANSTRDKKAMSFDDISRENDFRGFKKLPIVLLERMDITPLPKSNRYDNGHNRNRVINGVQKTHLHKLSLQVSVVLVRTDLDKLKREFNKTGNLSNNVCQKSNKTLGRLRSSSKNLWSSLLKDEKQPLKREETMKDTLESTRDLKIIKGNRGRTKIKAGRRLKGCVAKKRYRYQLPIDLTNEDESNNAVLAKMSKTSKKYLNVLTEKTGNENLTNTLCGYKSSSQLCRNSNDQSNFIANTINFNNPPRKAIIDPKSKKTIISRHHCDICGKYLSSNFTLIRHKATMHTADAKFGCDLCGEKFKLTSLLQSHRCPCENELYDPAPMIPFNDVANSLDVFNVDEEASIDNEDFEIPAPIVELIEYNDSEPLANSIKSMLCVMPLENKLYNLVVQEVPIEF